MKFSILIPTKDRLDLLKYAVESIRNQTYQNFEIIISDNYSAQDMKSWVEGLGDERILYYRQEAPVSVTENWNTANRSASGDYIIMLGDDDALLPEALQILYQYIGEYGKPQLIEFPAYHYLQPDVDPRDAMGSVDKTPLLFGGANAGLVPSRDRREAVKKCFRFNYSFGFNMQYFCYSRELVDILMRYGAFYEPPYPDYYTACMMMLVADTVLHIPNRLSIIGITRKSYGFYFRNNIEKEGMSFHKEADYRMYAPANVRDKLCSVDEIHTAAMATFSLIPQRIEFDEPDLLSYYKRVIERELKYQNLDTVLRLAEKEMFPHLDHCRQRALLRHIWIYLKNLTETGRTCSVKNRGTLPYADILEVIEAVKAPDSTLEDTSRPVTSREDEELDGMLDRMRPDVLREMISGRNVYVWGAYERGKAVKNFLEVNQIEVAGFVDQNPAMVKFLKLPVRRPQEIVDETRENYLVIPLRTVVRDVVGMLKRANYRNLSDFIYLGYSEKISVKEYYDCLGNKIISDMDVKGVYAKFYKAECELNIKERFRNNAAVLTVFYENDLRLCLDRGARVDGPYQGLRQILVRYGENRESAPTAEYRDCDGGAINLPSENGYAIVFNSEKVLLGVRVLTGDKRPRKA